MPPPCLNRWFDLGVILDISVQKLKEIKSSENIQPDTCCMRVITEWLDSDVNPTWNTLSKAINSILGHTTTCEKSHVIKFCAEG